MATSRKRVRSRLLARAAKSRPAAAPKQAEQAPTDAGPRVVGMPDSTPPWARADWQPARTGPAVSESLAAWQRMQEWEALRARHGGASVDMFGHRDHAPAGFHPLFGWKL